MFAIASVWFRTKKSKRKMAESELYRRNKKNVLFISGTFKVSYINKYRVLRAE